MIKFLKKTIKSIPGMKAFFNKCYQYKKKVNDYRRNIAPIKEFRRKHKKGVFLVLTPVHGNLGDHAIALSEIEFLKKANIEYFEIPGKQLFYLEVCDKLSVMNGSPILVTGGGFLGTLWYHDERVVRNVIISNPDSEILLFPSTIVYENSFFGNEEFEEAKKIYNSHKNLKLYTRESQSYELSKKLCRRTQLIPDMVMHIRKDESIFKRQGCLLCLRRDIERTISESEREILYQQVEALFNRVENIDTVKPYGIPIEKRAQEVEQLLNTIKKAELVVTDRLHGMIFCAITGTPCIVINSRSPKVLGCYEWIKHLPYIRICSDVKLLSDIYREMPHGSQKYDNTILLPLYDILLSDLRRLNRSYD